MIFNKESDFEEAIVQKLSSQKGWEKQILKYPTEKDLLRNWANILFENNRNIDRLNDYPLTDGEMQQIMEQIENLRSPLKLNGFINGNSVSIVRDNQEDKLHFGKEVSLKIYDRHEIAAGQSRYQIAQQPVFKSRSAILNDRRGDIMLLINGMPLIHIELKRSNAPLSEATRQIEKYSYEGVFSGLFSLVQVFVAMTPEETVYFANPGRDGKFNPNYYFHWADFNNEPINQWDRICSVLLSIPMVHQLIGFYTVADDTDGILKVLRSYQYHAVNAISDRVSKIKWDENNQLGGYVWHTTGAGKTMTSFKAAQLIASSHDADKVIFLMDRIELGTQSLNEYRGFANEDESVQATENTFTLISKLKSNNPADTLIVTSIQKMSNIRDDDAGLKTVDIVAIQSKRIVIIVDEAHRSTFGDMLHTIKKTFPRAVFFGFTGTPIHEENMKKLNTTSSIFGNELHRYSIADGIRDKNVLGFDPYKVLTFKDRDLRKAVALAQAKAASEEEAISDPNKSKIYYKFMDASKVPMAGYEDENGSFIKGIENYIPKEQYKSDEHVEAVIDDIIENWITLSRNSKFHAIFATSSIPEAINYYRKFKEHDSNLKITALFDPSIDNDDGFKEKIDGLVEIIQDYKKMFQQEFTLQTYAKMKKDIASRLAHKRPYQGIDKKPEKQIDILIVVDQMLTGFDSKWINTLYLDKELQYENIIQAFSRTNRLFGLDKPFGTIRYYRRPHTMEKNIEKAVKLYSGDKSLGLFVQRLYENLEKINGLFLEIKEIFEYDGIMNFERLPDDKRVCAKFASLFRELNNYLEAAKIQGFRWEKSEYINVEKNKKIISFLDETTYLVLIQRYKELERKEKEGNDSVAFDLSSYIIEIDTGKIDTEYLNSRFEKYIKTLDFPGVTKEEIQKAENELHNTFATLNQEQQKFANIFLHDIQRGEANLISGKTLMDYVNEYMLNASNDKLHKIATVFGLDEEKLRKMKEMNLNESNINEFGRYDEIKNTVDKKKAKEYFEKLEGKTIIMPKVNIKVDNLLRNFLTNDDFEFEIFDDE